MKRRACRSRIAAEFSIDRSPPLSRVALVGTIPFAIEGGCAVLLEDGARLFRHAFVGMPAPKLLRDGSYAGYQVMSFDIETDEELNDLNWPVTLGECIVLVAGYLVVLIGFGLLAAWILVQICMLVAKR